MTEASSEPLPESATIATKGRAKKGSKGIGDLPIVPEAEPRGRAPALVTAQDEKNYFDADQAAHELARRRLEMGFLGKFFGTWWTPSTIIAAIVALLIVAIWVVTLCVDRPDMAEARKYLFSGLLSDIAYIFGAASRSGRREA